MERFAHYFPKLKPHVWLQLKQYAQMLREWNTKINLVSRSDIQFLEEKHILPILPITTWAQWDSPITVLDVGTGGGIPGIPLAILFPQIQFTLLDSIQKKIRAVQAMIEALHLKNVQTYCERLEAHSVQYETIVGRSVKALDSFFQQVKKNLKLKNKGIFYWTGGEIPSITQGISNNRIQFFDLEEFFKGAYAITKKIAHVFPIEG